MLFLVFLLNSVNWIPFPHKLLLHLQYISTKPSHVIDPVAVTLLKVGSTLTLESWGRCNKSPSCNNPRGLLSMRYLYIMIIDIQAPDSHNTLNDHSHCEDHHNYGNLIFNMLSSSRKSSCFILLIPKNTYIYIMYLWAGRKKTKTTTIFIIY